MVAGASGYATTRNRSSRCLGDLHWLHLVDHGIYEPSDTVGILITRPRRGRELAIDHAEEESRGRNARSPQVPVESAGTRRRADVGQGLVDKSNHEFLIVGPPRTLRPGGTPVKVSGFFAQIRTREKIGASHDPSRSSEPRDVDEGVLRIQKDEVRWLFWPCIQDGVVGPRPRGLHGAIQYWVQWVTPPGLRVGHLNSLSLSRLNPGQRLPSATKS